MGYKTYQPTDNLKDLVQFFWVFEGAFTKANPYQHPITASVFPKLAFQYQGIMSVGSHSGKRKALFRSGFQAQTHQYHRIFAHQPVGIFGISFFPQSIPILFSIPADEITNYHVEISELLGIEGKQLEEKIILAQSVAERIEIVTGFLNSKRTQLTADKSLIISNIKEVVNKQGIIKVDELLSANFVSQRHFERKFKSFTGFSPKMFSRIVRFEESISGAFRGTTSLTQLAYDLGYYDQSHFIKDFREFSGQSPKDYFANDVSVFFDA